MHPFSIRENLFAFKIQNKKLSSLEDLFLLNLKPKLEPKMEKNLYFSIFDFQSLFLNYNN